MYYLKQKEFDDFRCIAAACPQSCCKGWQIVIDDDSLEKYNKELKDDERAKTSINIEEKCFKQCGKNCAFLDSDELCYLQRNYGEEMLCDTCRNFPRHIEEFECVREYSLDIACPHAAKQLLTKTAKMEFVEEEDDIDEEFEDFDYLLYDRLVTAREVIFSIAQNRKMPILDRLELIERFALKLQTCLDSDDLFGMDDVADEFETMELETQTHLDPDKEKTEFSILYELENLNEHWTSILEKTWKEVFEEKDSLAKAEKLIALYEIPAEQILMFFIFTYFCGSVYDDWIYSKAAFAVNSVKWIFFIAYSRITNNMEEISKEDAMEILIKSAYEYAREAEHSDINLDKLEEWFMR